MPGYWSRSRVSALAPGRAALEDQRRVERVGAVVDPVPQVLAAGLGERRLQQLAVLQRDDPPADQLEHLVDAAEQPVVHDAVEALAVVVDHPPEVPDVVLPAFEQRLEDVALVELGVADQRDHAAGRAIGRRRAASAARSPARARRTASSPRRGRPSRSRNRRRRRPWCATDRTARRPARGSARASRASGGRTGTGWRGRPGWRAASPRRGPRAAAPRNRAPSSASRARRTRPGGRRPSARRGSAAGGWRDGSSRTTATGPCARARGAGAGVAREPGWSWIRAYAPSLGKSLRLGRL